MASSTRRKSWIIWLRRLVLSVWFVALMSLLPISDYSDATLFFLIVNVLPAVVLVLFMMTVFIWHIFHGFIRMRRGENRSAWKHIAIVICGLVAIPTGRHLGDAFILALVATPLKAATEAADPAASALPIQASATAAIYVADSFFFTIQGIAYDKTGRLGDLLMTEPLKRPSEWQAAMPAILKAHGYPRHLYGNYWKVTMSMD